VVGFRFLSLLGLGEKVWVVNFRLEKSNDDCGLGAAAETSEEEDEVNFFVTSSSNVVAGCGFGQLNLNMEAQSVCSRCEVSGAINSRLELVIITRWLCSEVVGGSACTWTTSSSMLSMVGCVDVDAQLFSVATTSAVCKRLSQSCC
jgi:hypothetical protein